MAIDPSILRAMIGAVENEPDNVALRIHLASLLLQTGQDEEALQHYAFVLSRQPDHADALRGAAQAAEAVGDMPRAAGYRRLLDALSWNQARNMIESVPDAGPPLPPSADEDEPQTPPDDRAERLSIRLGPDDEDEAYAEVERPRITLADVAGMAEVKRRLNLAFLAPMRNPEIMKMYGKSLRGGLLLYGPPGCGKTFIARATAGEMGARFLAVGLSDVLDMWFGESERKLHQIFETARRNRPCVLFFDEIDALGRKRSLLRESAGRDVINQLLAELDGVQADNEGIFVLAATNHLWDVDTALRRPGRLDRTLLVLPPDTPAREAILQLNMRDRPMDGIDFATLAKTTEDYSGADLAHLCESAAELAMEESLTTGTPRPIRQPDFLHALKEVKASIRPWFETARNYAMFANEGGIYDDLLTYLQARRLL